VQGGSWILDVAASGRVEGKERVRETAARIDCEAKGIVEAPPSRLASWMAACSVQLPPAVAQTPSPGLASAASVSEFTV
jgi:hypothetical protein